MPSKCKTVDLPNGRSVRPGQSGQSADLSFCLTTDLSDLINLVSLLIYLSAERLIRHIWTCAQYAFAPVCILRIARAVYIYNQHHDLMISHYLCVVKTFYSFLYVYLCVIVVLKHIALHQEQYRFLAPSKSRNSCALVHIMDFLLQQ